MADTSLQGDAADSFDPLRPKLIRVAYRMLGSVADAEDVVQVSADAPAAVQVKPLVALVAAEAMEHFSVAGVMPVAGFVEQDAFEECLVFERLGDLVVVVAVFKPDGDAVGTGRSHEFEERAACGGHVGLGFPRTPGDRRFAQFGEPRFPGAAGVEHAPHLEFLLELFFHIAHLAEVHDEALRTDVRRPIDARARVADGFESLLLVYGSEVRVRVATTVRHPHVRGRLMHRRDRQDIGVEHLPQFRFGCGVADFDGVVASFGREARERSPIFEAFLLGEHG